MARRLTDRLSSAYVEAANAMRPSHKPRRVVAYVESYEDVAFWRTVLAEVETPQLSFAIMLPDRGRIVRGKKSAMASAVEEGRLGDHMIACVDADYDYLLQGHTPSSAAMLQCPHVFHTYVYAIESYQCYGPGLREAITSATLNDRQVIDTAAFVSEYSQAIWPLFVWSVWAYRYGGYQQFSLVDFANCVSLRNFQPLRPMASLDAVRRQANRMVSVMQRRHPEGKTTYAPLKEELRSLGVTPQTCYLYMQGHGLMDGVVVPLLSAIATLLRREREAEIKRLACHEQQRENELAAYRHGQMPVDAVLRRSQAFKQSEPYARLLNDLRLAFGGTDCNA